MNSVKRKRQSKRHNDEQGAVRLNVQYDWTDAEGVHQTTNEAGLPPQLRGPDGRPHLPPNHPVWDTVLDAFYEALNRAYLAKDPDKPLSRDMYWLLWERERETMLGLYRRWLGE